MRVHLSFIFLFIDEFLFSFVNVSNICTYSTFIFKPIYVFEIIVFYHKFMSKNLSNKKLIEMIKQERKLNLIMDNAQIHKAQVTKIVAKILNINIIYLPVYSPFLNPIEKVWADIKQELYKEYYESVEDIIQIFETEFYKIVDNKSYTENWVNKFLT